MASSSCWVWGIAGRSLAVAALCVVAGCGIPVGQTASSSARPLSRSPSTETTALQATILATSTATVVKLPGTSPDALLGLPVMTVGNDGAETAWRAYAWFDLSALARSARIESAELILASSNNAGGQAMTSTGHLKALATAWDATTLTWERQPPTAMSADLKIVLHRTQSEDRIDVTPLVSAWVSGELPNFGLRLETPAGNSFWKSYIGATTTDAARGPRLEIRYVASVPSLPADPPL